jgi:predicted lipoprotein with Yx(FWY)xxD motif
MKGMHRALVASAWACASVLAWTATAADDPPAARAASVPAAVELPAGFTAQTTLLGRVLADYKGRTLYYPASAFADRSTVAAWRPLDAPWLARPKAPWSTVALPDGGRQWAYQGHPLYRYDADKDPQDVRGQGLEGGWTAVVLTPPPALPPWATIQRVDIGWVFADRNGMTIYAPSRPEQIRTAQTCPKPCMEKYFRPLLAAPGDKAVGHWTIAVNEDGQRQWGYEGRLLYTHTRDRAPGEMRGQSFAVGYSIGDGFRVIPLSTQLASPGA